MAVVMQIAKIILRDDAAGELSFNAYTSAKEWLTQWTPRANFKAVYAETINEALEILRADLKENLVPKWMRGVSPHNFLFEVSCQEIEDNRFWMPSVCVWCKYHEIPKG